MMKSALTNDTHTVGVRWLGMLIVGLLLTGLIGMQTPSQAQASTLPEDPAELVIHKFEQPDNPGGPASGLPLDAAELADMVAVADVGFSATRIPDVDVTTSNGRRQAQELTVAHAVQATEQTSPQATGTTNANGTLRLQQLPIGLYLVEEASTPEGIVSADPFLVMLPMSHPSDPGWLSTVHVYPKNSPIDVTLSVRDASAVQTGDDISWHIAAGIPYLTDLHDFQIQNLFAHGISLMNGLGAIEVSLTAGAALVPTDYTIEEVTVNGRSGFQVVFSSSGRQKLSAARAANPQAQVHVTYLAPAIDIGEHTNQVQLAINDSASATDTATTKFGSLEIIVHQTGDPQNLIGGADFALYLSAEDARLDTNRIVVDGVDVWTTDSDGRITIDGLRLSNFVNGLERDPTDPSHRNYYLRPLAYPEGWTGPENPVAFEVTSAGEYLTLDVQVWPATEVPVSTEPSTEPVVSTVAPTLPTGPEPAPSGLASTGAQLLGLIVFALTLIGIGIYGVRKHRNYSERH